MAETVRVEPQAGEIRAELERIVQSEQFSSARRLRSFLEFVVNSALEGTEAKEAVIGVEVYGRDATYNPKTDSIVRAEASRLRAKLREYYDGPGQADPVVIELPKGSYVPAFHPRQQAAAPEPSAPVEVRKRNRLPAIAAALLLAAGVGWWAWPRIFPQAAIAVMPLRVLGKDPIVNPLVETLTSHLTQTLLATRSWRVAGLAPQLDLAGSDQVLAPLRRDLKADVVLTGSIRALEKQNARLTLELINVADGYLIWRESSDWTLTHLTESQKVVARAAVDAFTQKYTGRPAPSSNRAYAEARAAWSTYSTPGLEQSIVHFQKAIEADPNFAAAWAGMADAYVRLADDVADLDTHDKVEAARKAATRAIELDPGNAEAHSALGRIYFSKDFDFAAAREHLSRAVASDPTRVWPNVTYSQLLTVNGDFDQALEVIRDARSRLPALPQLMAQEGSVFFLAHKFEKMEALGREVVAAEPESTIGHWLVGLSLELRGKVKEAIAEYQAGLRLTVRENHRILCALSHAYGLAGERAKALETRSKFLPNPDAKPSRYTLAYCAALTEVGLGQKDEAFRWLQVGFQVRDNSMPFFASDARFDPLKSDPRYRELVTAVLRPKPGTYQLH
ncbi:MAG: tetratricopeptide repeat protein [Bryobacteraceae bacterium]